MFQPTKYIGARSFGLLTKTDKTSLLTTLLKSELKKPMPQELFDVDRFVQASGRAEYCAIKRLRRTVKLKLRTPNKLYTLKVEPIKAEEIIKKLRCEIREV